MKKQINQIWFCLYALMIAWGIIATISAVIIVKNKDSITNFERDITQLRAMVQENKQRQLDLITFNDCMACHPQERRCENINGVIWEVER